MGKPRSGFLSALGVLFQIFKALVDDVLAAGGTDDDIRRIQTDAELRRQIVGLIVMSRQKAVVPVPDINWLEAYKALGMEAEYAEFAKANPGKADPNLWVVPVIEGITCNKVVATLRQLGVEVYLYTDDLDKAVPTNDRDTAKGSYSVSFRRNVEADEENKNKSANMLAKEGHKGITLLERLLLELGYFLAAREHLDKDNWTLCAGSRDSVGGVPHVRWYSDSRGVGVGWYDPDGSVGGLRSRSAVSDVSCLRSEA